MNQATAPQRWQKVKTIFQEAVELPSHERAVFLATACDGDANLRAQVERMLAADDRDPSFLESSPVQHLIESSQQIQSGHVIGAYQIKDKLGAGGMGDVYCARDLRLEREVAVKVLPGLFTSDESRVQRFIREARAASALNHPNIVTIHEVGQVDQIYFIVTELVEGKTLRRLMDERPLQLAEVVDIGLQMVSALTAAHEAGIVHRDIKPENVMIREDDLVKVLDFGLAKLTERKSDGATARWGEDDPVRPLAPPPSLAPSTASSIVMGTARYMSPEQARGVNIDERSDIFSFGSVLYEMLTGHPPFQGETTTDVIIAVVEKDPLPVSSLVAGIPTELQQIVHKTLQKNREERYQTSKELLADIKSFKRLAEAASGELTLVRRAIPHQSAATGFTLTAEYLAKQIKQHNRASLAALVIVLVAIAAVSWFFFSKRTYALSEKDTVLLAD
ncbi:MAG: serine/threonine protein kinase, partial [Acidobacteria bacterium]|nr:serine/threonine protein kinase [Acidobacteriota bacterium]